jgi:LytTr DNA-binding domain
VENRIQPAGKTRTVLPLETGMNELSGSEFVGDGLQVPQEGLRNAPGRPGATPEVPKRTANTAEFRSPAEIPPVKTVKIAIKTKGTILLVNPGDILAVEADGNYVLLRLQASSLLLRESMSTIAEKLKSFGFVRIHRSVLVNSSWVEEIRPGATGEYLLRITGGREYVVSRTYKHNLKSLAQSWIGTDSFVDD